MPGHLSSRLSDYDLFAIQPTLTIKGRGQMASIVGLLLTFLTFLSLGGFTIYLVVKMLLRDNPNVTMSEVVTNVYNGDSVTIALNNASFYFGFGLFTEEVVSDPEILDIDISGYNYTLMPPNQIVTNNFSMEAVICDWFDIYGDWGTAGYCLNKDFTLLSGMQGPDHLARQSLSISFAPCSANTSPICKDRQNIDQIFSESAFRVTYINPSVDNNNHAQPITINYVDYEEYILPGYTKTLTFFITKIKVITDSGWLLGSTTEEDAIFVEDQRTTIQPRYDDNSELFKFVITANDKVIIYNRSYTKLQDVFGEITGLASFIVLILAVFARPYFQFKMTEALVNNIYDVLVQENAHSSMIGIIDQNTAQNHNHDKKDPDLEAENVNIQKHKSLRKSIITRSKSRKVGIEEQANKAISTFETQTALQSEINPPKKSQQAETTDLDRQNEEPLKSDHGTENKVNSKEKNNALIEIELETGMNVQENTQAPDPGPVTVPAEIAAHLGPRYKLDVSFTEWLLSFFKPQLQVKILHEAEEMLSRNLDIVSVAKNISEINKLKACLLDDHQRILFENLPSSFVMLDPENRMKASKDGRNEGRESCSSGEGSEDEKVKAKEAYKAIKESRNKSPLDSRLLALYEKKGLHLSVPNRDNG